MALIGAWLLCQNGIRPRISQWNRKLSSCPTCRYVYYLVRMEPAAEKNPAAVLLGRNGGFARAKKLSAQERKRLASIAGRASAEAKRKKAGKSSSVA
jgi:hypothetical protein